MSKAVKAMARAASLGIGSSRLAPENDPQGEAMHELDFGLACVGACSSLLRETAEEHLPSLLDDTAASSTASARPV